MLSCSFCGFARKPGQAGAYEHTIEDMVAMVKDETREVHIVGGHHPDWPFEYYERMIEAMHQAHPDVQIKALHRRRDRLLLAALEDRAAARRSRA